MLIPFLFILHLKDNRLFPSKSNSYDYIDCHTPWKLWYQIVFNFSSPVFVFLWNPIADTNQHCRSLVALPFHRCHPSLLNFLAPTSPIAGFARWTPKWEAKGQWQGRCDAATFPGERVSWIFLLYLRWCMMEMSKDVLILSINHSSLLFSFFGPLLSYHLHNWFRLCEKRRKIF